MESKYSRGGGGAKGRPVGAVAPCPPLAGYVVGLNTVLLCQSTAMSKSSLQQIKRNIPNKFKVNIPNNLKVRYP